ncbi:hypothetical protein VTN96DRAFT_3402 [Rasamsonia emersonii]
MSLDLDCFHRSSAAELTHGASLTHLPWLSPRRTEQAVGFLQWAIDVDSTNGRPGHEYHQIPIAVALRGALTIWQHRTGSGPGTSAPYNRTDRTRAVICASHHLALVLHRTARLLVPSPILPRHLCAPRPSLGGRRGTGIVLDLARVHQPGGTMIRPDALRSIGRGAIAVAMRTQAEHRFDRPCRHEPQHSPPSCPAQQWVCLGTAGDPFLVHDKS